MKTNILFTRLISLLIILTACCKKSISVLSGNDLLKSSQVIIDHKLVEATVLDYRNLDGCTFLMQLNNGEKLQPENLDSVFQKNNLQVLIKYHLTGKNTICMTGKTILIDFIKLKNEK